MDDVQTAEKEASEVLHSLLSVPRIKSNRIFVPVQECSSVGKEITWRSDEGIYCVQNDKLFDDTAPDIEEEFVILEDEPTSTTDIEVCTTSCVSSKVFAKKKTAKIREDKKIEDTSQEVRDRFNEGCDCQGESCFEGLNPEAVYKHRLNIAELTKEEHDMYLMGLSMACLGDPSSTVKLKARQRLRSSYLHHGRKVCLSAFLYLENCTLYQLKRIRKHLVTHGVVPRVHGNHGKKPHNVFSLDIYQRATVFLKEFIKRYSSSSNPKTPVLLPPEMSRKHVHKIYQKFVRENAPEGEKVMGYSTFRHFVKEQFPHLKFSRTDIGLPMSGVSSKQLLQLKNKLKERDAVADDAHANLPVVLRGDNCQTYIVTPMEPMVACD